MKAAYVGIDLFYPALPALARAGCEIMKIFTCQTDNVTEFNLRVCAYARDRAIPLQTDRVRPEDLAALRQAGCELLLCAGYYYRLPVEDGFPMVNIHPAWLPIGRGAWPMAVTILRGLNRSGVTFHKITSELDQGDILLRRSLDVAPDETLLSLTEKQCALLPSMVEQLCARLDRLWAEAIPQGPGEYWPCPTQKDWTVTPDMTVEEADRVLRAFYGYEVILRRPEGDWELIEAVLAEGPRPEYYAFPFREKTICARRARRLST